MFICAALCRFSVPVLLVWVFPLSSLLLLTCRLVICRSAKLEFCTLPRTQERMHLKKKKKGKEGGSKDNTNYRLSDHRLIKTKLFKKVIYPRGYKRCLLSWEEFWKPEEELVWVCRLVWPTLLNQSGDLVICMFQLHISTMYLPE